MQTTSGVEQLPPELLEHVLRDLPLLDLVRSQQVCRRWTDLIGSSGKLRRAMYKSVKPEQPDKSHSQAKAARLNPLLSGCQHKTQPFPSDVHHIDDFEDGCDSVANCRQTPKANYPDELYGVVASGCSLYTMIIPHFRQRLDETARCSLTSLGAAPSWMAMHVFRRQCRRLSVTIQSLSSPGELKCIIVENPGGIRLGDVMRSIYIDHVR